jgi:hypothetical protein
MAVVKVTAFPAATDVVDADLVPVVDDVAGTPTTKKATWSQVWTWIQTKFGAGIATFLGTPSSENLRSAVTDETGTGSLVFANTPTLVTPAIGAATGTSTVLTSHWSTGTTPATAGAGRMTGNTYINAWSPTGAADIRLLGLVDAGTPTAVFGGVGADLNMVTDNSHTATFGALSHNFWSGSTAARKFAITSTGIQLGPTQADHGGGTGVFGIDDASVVPTTNPTNGIVVYSEGGVGKLRQANGTIVTLANSAVGGANTQVLFNDGGVEAGDAGLTYNKTTDVLSVATAVALGTAATTGSIRLPAGGSIYGILGGSGDNRVLRAGDGGGFAVELGDGNTGTLQLFTSGSASNGIIYNSGGFERHWFSLSGYQVGSGTPDFGGGDIVIGLKNASPAPSTNPTGGGILYSDAGAGKWRGSGGTVTTFGPAEPHCPTCGRDFALEHRNDDMDEHLALCLPCMVDSLVSAGINVNAFAMVNKRTKTKQDWTDHMAAVAVKEQAEKDRIAAEEAAKAEEVVVP